VRKHGSGFLLISDEECSMEELMQMKCEVCRVGAPQATDEEVAIYLKQIPDWSIAEYNVIRQLERTFRFKNFVDALAFANTVGALAEEEGHHPSLLVEWGKVRVIWWTHKIKGLHRNDFIMAAKTDEAFTSSK